MPEQNKPADRNDCASSDRASKLPIVLTVDEVADLLRVNRNTVYELFQRGEIPGGRHVGRSIRFSSETLLKWLQGKCPLHT